MHECCLPLREPRLPGCVVATTQQADSAFSLLVHAVQHGLWTEMTAALKQVDDPVALVRQTDADLTTALHWAALNSRVDMAVQLLRLGALPNATGGSNADTPLHWACTNGSLRTASALIQYGANANLPNRQGYTAAHIAVQHHHAFLALFLIHMGCSTDAADLPATEHSLLHWAVFRQAPNELFDVLLAMGGTKALSAVDSLKRTPLHWAACLGYRREAKRLLESGGAVAVCDAKDADGKTPADLATMSHQQSWFLPLEVYYKKEVANMPKLNILKRAIYVMSLFTFPVIILIGIHANWLYSLLMIGVVPVSCVSSVSKCAFQQRPIQVARTPIPFLVNISGMAALLLVHTIHIAPEMLVARFLTSELIFFSSYALMVYFLFKASFLQPGYIDLPENQDQVKSLVFELSQSGLLSCRHYCTTCQIRKPLRSKHCRLCNRCIAKMDHHCPWMWNCIGEKNYFSFCIYMGCGLVCIVAAIYLNFHHLSLAYTNDLSDKVITSLEKSMSERHVPCMLWPKKFCALFSFMPVSFIALVLSAIFMPWLLLILLATHIYQICKAYTSNEMANCHRLDYFYPTVEELVEHDGRTAVGVLRAPGHFEHKRQFASPRGFPVLNTDVCQADDPEWLRSWPLHRRPFSNAFDAGVWSNCVDFWCRKNGIHSHLDYYTLYRRPAHCLLHENHFHFDLSTCKRARHRPRGRFQPWCLRWRDSCFGSSTPFSVRYHALPSLAEAKECVV